MQECLPERHEALDSVHHHVIAVPQRKVAHGVVALGP